MIEFCERKNYEISSKAFMDIGTDRSASVFGILLEQRGAGERTRNINAGGFRS